MKLRSAIACEKDSGLSVTGKAPVSPTEAILEMASLTLDAEANTLGAIGLLTHFCFYLLYFRFFNS